MRSVIILAGAVVVIIAISVGISQSQQDPARSPEQTLIQILERTDRMEQSQKQILQKLDAVIANQHKLDTVLANQQKILSELDIVKVRATHR